MSERGMAPSGARVASGRLRVDAARAVDKLRGYQLPDPTMWVLEVVRAATLAGAERIRVHGDADDVVVSWDGPPLDAGDLARLFDELVDPAPDADRRHLRLLATGVNTALGLDPRWVDVITCDGAGGAQAVRYTPRLLERGEDGTARGLRELAAEPRVAVPLAPVRGGMVHVRRLPLLGALPILIGIGEPAELSVVRRACDDVRVPLTVGRAALGRDRSHGDLLRISLGDGLDGFLAVVDPSVAAPQARIDVAELGVLLARYSLPLEGLSLEGPPRDARAKVPLRLFIDAARMPTNASRSAVRLDEPPVRDAIESARERLGALIERLRMELSDEGAHAWSAHQRERLRAAALSLIASAVAGADWRAALVDLERAGAYGAAVAPLARLPLVRDAIGRPRAPASLSPRAGIAHVHTSLDPVSDDLEPWLGEVLWIPPGDPASVLLGEARPLSTKPLLARVRGHRSARARWLNEKPRAVLVPEAPGQLLAVPIAAPGKSLKSCAPPDVYRRARGAEGELVLRDPRSTRGSSVVLSIGGREIERLSIDLPVPVVAAVEHAQLRPSPDYRSVERDEVFDAVLDAVYASAIVACEALALRMERRAKAGDRATLRAPWIEEGRAQDRPALAAVVRGGLELALAVHEGEQSDADDEAEVRARVAARLRAGKSPLLEAGVWPALGGGWRSLRAIEKEASRSPHVIAYARTGPDEAAREGARTVHLLSRAEAQTMASLVAPAALVDYGPALSRPLAPRGPAELARGVLAPGGAVLAVEGQGYAAVVATSASPGLEVRHWGRTLARDPIASDLGPLRVVVEDERVVPGADWSTLRAGPPEPYPVRAWHRALYCAFADALIGRSPPELTIHAWSPRSADLAWVAFSRAVAQEESTPAEWLGAERLAELRRAPLVEVLGEASLVDLDTLSARFPDAAIPWVPYETALPFDLGDWHPLRASELDVAAYARLLGRELAPASGEIERRKRAAAREIALHRHRLGAVEDPARDWSPSVVLAGTGFRSGVAALASSPERGAQIIVSIEGRRFTTIEREDDLPLRLAVDFGQLAADEDFRALTPASERILEQAVRRGARALLRTLAREDPPALVAAPRAFALLCAWAARIGDEGSDRKLADRLFGVAAFPTVQGPVASLDEAATANGMLRFAEWDDVWLAPVDGERQSAYDRPVARIPTDEGAGAAMRGLLERLWTRGPARDVSASVARLQTERRIARGLVQAPRLSRVKDPRFRYPLDELLADDAQAAAALGLGEAALDDGELSRIQLFESGASTRSIELNLIPRVVIAASSPLTRAGRTIDKSTRERLHEALRAVTSHLIRRVVDETPPDQLPEWVRRELCASCLHGGATHLERLAGAPIFETTSGAWVTPGDLRAQVERFGSVWWTSDLATRRVPLDEARIALRLPSAQAALLAGWIELTEAANELALDQKARANRDRPPIESLEPTQAERAIAAAIVRLESEVDDPSHGFVVVLAPGHGAARGTHLHREMRSFGMIDDPSHWPAIARIEHPGLTPNRAWDGPEEDEQLAHVRARVRRAVEREMMRLLPFPVRRRFVVRLRTLPLRSLELPHGAIAEGVASIASDLEAGAFTVRDSLGERSVTPAHEGRGLPISGTLWIEGAQIHGGSARVFGAIHRELLRRVATQLKRDPQAQDLALQLVRGLSFLERTWAPPIALSCFSPEPWSLPDLLEHLERGGFVRVTSPERAGDARRSNPGEPILVNDGSPLAVELARGLGARALEWPGALRAYVGEEAPLPGTLRAYAGEAAPLPGEADPEPAATRPAIARPAPSALEVGIATALARAGLPGVSRARIERRGKPLVEIEGDALVLAGSHPLVRAADGTDARIAVLLVTRAAGVLRREERIDARGELEAIERLLDAVADAGASE